MTHDLAIPRWARELGAETWTRINERLYEGHQPVAVMRTLGLPASKLRSLTAYARKYRHRRILAPAARLAEMLTCGAEGMGTDAVRLFRMVLEQSLTAAASDKQRNRAAEIMLKYLGEVGKMGAAADKAETNRERDHQDETFENMESMLDRVARDVYGLEPARG